MLAPGYHDDAWSMVMFVQKLQYILQYMIKAVCAWEIIPIIGNDLSFSRNGKLAMV